MDQNLIREMLIDRMRRHSESLDQAAATVTRGFGVAPEVVAPAVESIRREGRKNMLLDAPPGVFDPGVEGEARLAGWYSGPEPGDELWPRFRSKLEAGPMRSVVHDIDLASTKVVAHFADPHIWNLKKRGLVVGYVQSGKTANYTAVMAKAADAGYKMFIVLAGLHNNLRRQTQVRLSKDLVDHDWTPLTSNDQDFGNVVNGAAMLGRGVNTIAVVKKNPARLRRLRDWLRDIPEGIRERVPIVILDDEADQATPNSAAARDQMTRINALTREIWSEIRTGTYVGYTATPFANIFMNPADEDELYPADFIIDLPRPDAYFGAERVFGREPINDADAPDPGLDMVRDVPDDDALILRPSSSAEDRATFDPELPPSLVDAARWFVVATAIRRARAQLEHGSMLVHTTHYVQPHFAMKRRLDALIEVFRREADEGRLDRFAESFAEEADRAIEVASVGLPSWSDVARYVPEVLGAIRVVVDNGSSMDRLDYERTDESGNPVPETVIAVGGGTLSRGLTLEGLIVSYFTRTSNTYDTLLQMGRWFGYRSGYEDLPRIWMQPALAEEFRFLALVEEEIRQDMRHMERMNVTPRQLGVRVRAHPGRLSIVARNKMHHADVVRVSYSGSRLQTFILDETNVEVLSANLQSARDLLAACQSAASPTKPAASRWLFEKVPAELVLSLLAQYQFHPDQLTMNPGHMSAWIRNAAPTAPWNVVVIGSEKRLRNVDGRELDLGVVDLGLDVDVPVVNRTPLAREPLGRANIKSLLSHMDWFADLEPELISSLSDNDRRDARGVREQYAGGRGLVIVYPISRNSVPMGAARAAGSRRAMAAPEHLIGLGLIFPAIDRDGLAGEGTYYSVHPDWEEEVGDDELPQDLEGSMVVDGDAITGRR